MEVNEILVHGLVERILAGLMELEQVPVPYKEAVGNKLDLKE